MRITRVNNGDYSGNLHLLNNRIIMGLKSPKTDAWTQKEWIALFNAQGKGLKRKRMLSASDAFRVPEKSSKEEVESLQQECRALWVITSTHHTYHPKNPACTISHNYQSTVVAPRVITLDSLPVLRGVPASKLIRTQSGRLYLGALEDDMYAQPATLLNRLVAFAQRDPEDIFFYTPTVASRRRNPERAVRLDSDCDGFYIRGDIYSKYISGNIHNEHILADISNGYGGRTRSVLVSKPCKQTKK